MSYHVYMEITTDAKVNISTQVMLSDVIEALGDAFDDKQMVQFIMKLDDQAGNWEFTRRLFKAVQKLAAEHDEEIRVDFTRGFADETDLWLPTRADKKKAKAIRKQKKAEKKAVKKEIEEEMVAA